MTNTAETIEWVRTYSGTFPFLRDMASRANSGKGFTAGQLEAIARCMARETARSERSDQPINVDASTVRSLLADARQHIAWPKIRLGEYRLRLRRNGRIDFQAENRWETGRYGDQRVWLGGTVEDGSVRFSGRCSDQIRAELIGILNMDRDQLVAHIARVGKLIGQCCFCGLTLSDPRSVDVGYGPICADHWRLPWGEK